MIAAEVYERQGPSPVAEPMRIGRATWSREEGWHDTSGEWQMLAEIEPSPAILGEDEWRLRMNRRGGMAYVVVLDTPAIAQE